MIQMVLFQNGNISPYSESLSQLILFLIWIHVLLEYITNLCCLNHWNFEGMCNQNNIFYPDRIMKFSTSLHAKLMDLPMVFILSVISVFSDMTRHNS